MLVGGGNQAAIEVRGLVASSSSSDQQLLQMKLRCVFDCSGGSPVLTPCPPPGRCTVSPRCDPGNAMGANGRVWVSEIASRAYLHDLYVHELHRRRTVIARDDGETHGFVGPYHRAIRLKVDAHAAMGQGKYVMGRATQKGETTLYGTRT